MTGPAASHELQQRFGIQYDAATKTYSGSNYAQVINKLIDKTKYTDYVVMGAIDEPISGLQTFAVREPDGNVVVSVRGTNFDSPADLANLATLGMAGDAMQEETLVAFLQKLEEEGAQSFTLTGHSLGGYDAISAAAKFDKPNMIRNVVTFNSPTGSECYQNVNSEYLEAIDSKVTNYCNEYDTVSAINQEHRKIGKTIYTESNYTGNHVMNEDGILPDHRQENMAVDENGNIIANKTNRPQPSVTVTAGEIIGKIGDNGGKIIGGLFGIAIGSVIGFFTGGFYGAILGGYSFGTAGVTIGGAVQDTMTQVIIPAVATGTKVKERTQDYLDDLENQPYKQALQAASGKNFQVDPQILQEAQAYSGTCAELETICAKLITLENRPIPKGSAINLSVLVDAAVSESTIQEAIALQRKIRQKQKALEELHQNIARAEKLLREVSQGVNGVVQYMTHTAQDFQQCEQIMLRRMNAAQGGQGSASSGKGGV